STVHQARECPEALCSPGRALHPAGFRHSRLHQCAVYRVVGPSKLADVAGDFSDGHRWVGPVHQDWLSALDNGDRRRRGAAASLCAPVAGAFSAISILFEYPAMLFVHTLLLDLGLSGGERPRVWNIESRVSGSGKSIARIR